jgi:cell division protein FtsL
MATRKQIKERSIERVRRERAPIPWRYFLLSMFCSVILAVGFFNAAKQHFASVDYSMRNSEMRKEREKLEAEKRKLKVERELAGTQSAIEKAGIKMGLKKLDTQDFRYIDPSGAVTAATTAAEKSTKSTDSSDKTAALAGKNVAADTKTKPGPSLAKGAKNDPTAGGKKEIAKLMARENGQLAIARK